MMVNQFLKIGVPALPAPRPTFLNGILSAFFGTYLGVECSKQFRREALGTLLVSLSGGVVIDVVKLFVTLKCVSLLSIHRFQSPII